MFEGPAQARRGPGHCAPGSRPRSVGSHRVHPSTVPPARAFARGPFKVRVGGPQPRSLPRRGLAESGGRAAAALGHWRGRRALSQRAWPTWCGRGGRMMGPPLLPPPRRRGPGLGRALLGAALLGGILLAAHADPDPYREGADPCRACRGLADSFIRVRGGGTQE